MALSKQTVRRGSTRRTELTIVAQRMFIERGYEQTTMHAIAEEAGASKETLYRHFKSKGEFFEEIMHMKSSQIAAAIDTDLSVRSMPKVVLRAMGLNILKILSTPDVLSFLRMIVSEVPRHPELGQTFYLLGPAIIQQKLANYLTEATKVGFLKCDNPQMAAKLFLGVLLTDVQLLGLISAAFSIDDGAIEEHVDASVSMFLFRYSCLERAPFAHMHK